MRALLAGADQLLMSPALDAAFGAVLDAVESGRISRRDLDAKVRRVLTLKAGQGVVEHPCRRPPPARPASSAPPRTSRPRTPSRTGRRPSCATTTACCRWPPSGQDLLVTGYGVTHDGRRWPRRWRSTAPRRPCTRPGSSPSDAADRGRRGRRGRPGRRRRHDDEGLGHHGHRQDPGASRSSSPRCAARASRSSSSRPATRTTSPTSATPRPTSRPTATARSRCRPPPASSPARCRRSGSCPSTSPSPATPTPSSTRSATASPTEQETTRMSLDRRQLFAASALGAAATAVAVAPGARARRPPPVLAPRLTPGADRAAAARWRVLAGRKVGVVTNPTGVLTEPAQHRRRDGRLGRRRRPRRVRARARVPRHRAGRRLGGHLHRRAHRRHRVRRLRGDASTR